MVSPRRSARVIGLWVPAALIALGGPSSAGSSAQPDPGPASMPSTSQLGKATGYVAPLTGALVVLTSFRPPAERYGRGHRGVDLAAPAGSTVRAAGAGVVVYSGQLAGRGVVSIEHASGLRTTYEPLLPSVPAGAVVTAGQPIGTLAAGHPSCSPPSCLHWGARLGADSYLDPMLLIGRVRIRLEPWS